jgi:hypothetical protein
MIEQLQARIEDLHPERLKLLAFDRSHPQNAHRPAAFNSEPVLDQATPCRTSQ